MAFSSSIHSYPLLLVGRFIFGVGAESSYVAQNAMCVRWFSQGGLATAMSVTVTLGRVGSVLVFNTLPVIAERTGKFQISLWISFFVVCSSLLSTIGYAALNSRASKMLPAHQENDDDAGRITFSSLGRFNRSYWILLVLVVVFYASVFPFTAIASEKFHEHFHITTSQASRLTSVVIFTSMVGAPLFGHVADRFEEHVPILCSVGAYTVLPAYLLLAFTHASPLVPMLFLGVAFSIFPSAAWPAFSRIVPPELNATAFGIVTAAQNAALSLLQYVTGVVADRVKFRYLMVYFVCLATVAALWSIVWMVVDARNPAHRVEKIRTQREAKEKEERAQRYGEPHPVLAESPNSLYRDPAEDAQFGATEEYE